MIPELMYNHQPKSCGKKANIRAYKSWRVHWCQLWRHSDYIGEKVKFEPIKINQSVVAHSTPPRQKDKVMCYGVFGVILYVNREFNEACVRHFDVRPYRDETYDLDLFEAQSGKIRWRIE